MKNAYNKFDQINSVKLKVGPLKDPPGRMNVIYLILQNISTTRDSSKKETQLGFAFSESLTWYGWYVHVFQELVILSCSIKLHHRTLYTCPLSNLCNKHKLHCKVNSGFLHTSVHSFFITDKLFIATYVIYAAVLYMLDILLNRARIV
jgi:hypothetical protein